jgi:phosphate transport system ATP-binding protein
MRVETKRQALPPRERLERIFGIEGLDALYSGKPAIKGVTMDVYKNLVTAIIGPSGCGKSTYIRCLNRMNDLIPGFSLNGAIRYHGQDICGSDVDPVAVRRHIGMVFQRPNPFPKSIYDNVAWGCRVLGMKDNLDAGWRLASHRRLWDG